MRDALLRPRITRRSALQMAGAAVLPALIKPARAAEPSTLRVAFAIQPATLDPQKMRVGGVDYNYVYNCFSRLTAQDPQLQVQPDLATSWEAAEDLKTWTFHLRPGVKFHNGKPFDASDVVFTFKRILDKDVGSVLRVNFSIVDSIEAVDPLTVRFNLSVAYADLPAAAAAYQAAIVNESTLDTLTTHPIGTGPFKFVEYRPGDQLVMERNPDYFLPGVPRLDRVIIRIIPEFTTSVAALESGAVDAVFLPAAGAHREARQKQRGACRGGSGRTVAGNHLELRDEAVRRLARAASLQQADRQARHRRDRDVRPRPPDIDADPAVSPVFPQGHSDRRRRHRRCEEIAGRSGDPQRLGSRNVRAGQQSPARAARNRVPRRRQAGRHQCPAAHRAA